MKEGHNITQNKKTTNIFVRSTTYKYNPIKP